MHSAYTMAVNCLGHWPNVVARTYESNLHPLGLGAFGFRPRPGLSLASASHPPSENLRRQRLTVWRLTPSRRATARAEYPFPSINTMRLRRTTRCGMVRERDHCSITSRSSVRSSNLFILSIGLANFLALPLWPASQTVEELWNVAHRATKVI